MDHENEIIVDYKRVGLGWPMKTPVVKDAEAVIYHMVKYGRPAAYTRTVTATHVNINRDNSDLVVGFTALGGSPISIHANGERNDVHTIDAALCKTVPLISAHVPFSHIRLSLSEGKSDTITYYAVMIPDAAHYRSEIVGNDATPRRVVHGSIDLVYESGFVTAEPTTYVKTQDDLILELQESVESLETAD